VDNRSHHGAFALSRGAARHCGWNTRWYSSQAANPTIRSRQA
jgi:hypothetical protein